MDPQRQVAGGAAGNRRLADVDVAGRPRKHHLEEAEEAETGRGAVRRRSATGGPALEHRGTDTEMREMTEAPNDAGLDLDGDRLREECGVFGIFGHPDAAAITALGLH